MGRITQADIDRARQNLGIRGVAARATQPPASTGGNRFLSSLAAAGRRIPRPIRDVLGSAAQTALSGERFLNVISPGDPGTAIRRGLERVPAVGGALGTAFDIAAAPATLIPGAVGGRFAVAAGRGLGGRLAGEAAVALGVTGGAVAAQRGLAAAEERGLPVPGALKVGVPLAAGLLLGVRGVKALGPGRAAAREAEMLQRFGDLSKPITKLSALIDEAKPILAEQGIKRSEELARRGKRIESVLKAHGGDREAFRLAGAQRAGELPKAVFAPPDPHMTEDEVTSMFRAIFSHPPFENRAFDKQSTGDALVKVLAGELPQPAELGLLEDVFGDTIIQSLMAKRPASAKAWTTLIDIAGIPRSVMASFDISAPFRQGALLVSRKEFWGAWKPMIKAFGSETYANAVDVAIRNDKVIQGAVTSAAKGGPGLYIAPLGRAAALGRREEAFMSRLAQNIPGIARSERSFVTFLNKLRADTYTNTAQRFARNGAGPDDYRSLARWINVATGRGSLPDSQLAALSSTIFFSPRLLAARLMTPVELARATPLVRREIARDMVSFVGAGLGALTLLHLSGQASIELDPRSSDFGKGRIGKTRYDPWAGFQPIARYITQAITGERKTTGTGEVVAADRKATLLRFAQSKLAPVPGLALDLFRGQTFLGEEVGFTPTRETSEAAISRLVPLFLQDVIDAAREEGLTGVLMSLPGATGVGVQSFTTLNDVRNEVAGLRHQKPWGDLTGLEQQALETEFQAELQGAQVRSDFSDRKDEIETDIRARESELAAGIAEGQSPRAIADALSALNRERTIRINEAFVSAGFEPGDNADDPIQRVFATRELAVRNGIVDFQLLDQFERDALEALTPDERRKFEERRRFTHDPSVEHIFAAKDYIAEAGYWQVQRDAFGRFQPRIAAIDPSIVTYQQLEMRIRVAERQGERGLARRLSGIKNRIDSTTTKQRKTMRRRDPLLQEAGVTVYGWKPPR